MKTSIMAAAVIGSLLLLSGCAATPSREAEQPVEQSAYQEPNPAGERQRHTELLEATLRRLETQLHEHEERIRLLEQKLQLRYQPLSVP